MRTLPKHLRPRWRYLAVEIETWPNAEIDRRGFQGALWEAARGLVGDPGSADCDLTVTRFRFDENRGTGDAIVRVRREEVTRSRAALACVSVVEGFPIGFVVRGVSGTIRGCQERLGDRPDSESGAETTVRFPAVDTSRTDPPITDRPAVEKPGGRFDVRTSGGSDEGERFVGATALNIEFEQGAEATGVETETADTEERE